MLANSRIVLLIMLVLLPFTMEAKKRVVLNEQGDTVKYLHPKFNGITVGADIFSPIANVVGQKYGNYELSVDAGFYNRFYPIYEAGVAYANETPDGSNFTYKLSPSFYNRIGLNYNIMYNRDISGIFYVGLRYGLSFADYELNNITVTSPYWDDVQSGLSIAKSKSTAHWGELLLGLQMKIYKGFMMGWSVRYKLLFAATKNGDAEQWIIPGFGKRNNPLGFTFTLNYRFCASKKVNHLAK